MKTRRTFLKNTALGAFSFGAGLVFITSCASSDQAKSEFDKLLVDPNEPLAKSMRFVADSTKSEESNGNKCATCQHFTEKADRSGKKIGSCNIFQGKYVSADSYCVAWAKR